MKLSPAMGAPQKAHAENSVRRKQHKDGRQAPLSGLRRAAAYAAAPQRTAPLTAQTMRLAVFHVITRFPPGSQLKPSVFTVRHFLRMISQIHTSMNFIPVQ